MAPIHSQCVLILFYTRMFMFIHRFRIWYKTFTWKSPSSFHAQWTSSNKEPKNEQLNIGDVITLENLCIAERRPRFTCRKWQRWLQVARTLCCLSTRRKQSCRTTCLAWRSSHVWSHNPFPFPAPLTGVIWASPRAATTNFTLLFYTKLGASVQ